MFATDNNLRSEPKFIVFFTQLLALFKFCPNCKAENCDVEVHQNGTMAKVKCTCTNPKCNNRNFKWTSQPLIPGTKLRAGNFLLSFAIIVAGASPTKILRVLQHMGVACISLSTFFSHQHVSKFLTILLVCQLITVKWLVKYNHF